MRVRSFLFFFLATTLTFEFVNFSFLGISEAQAGICSWCDRRKEKRLEKLEKENKLAIAKWDKELLALIKQGEELDRNKFLIELEKLRQQDIKNINNKYDEEAKLIAAGKSLGPDSDIDSETFLKDLGLHETWTGKKRLDMARFKTRLFDGVDAGGGGGGGGGGSDDSRKSRYFDAPGDANAVSVPVNDPNKFRAPPPPQNLPSAECKKLLAVANQHGGTDAFLKLFDEYKAMGTPAEIQQRLDACNQEKTRLEGEISKLGGLLQAEIDKNKEMQALYDKQIAGNADEKDRDALKAYFPSSMSREALWIMYQEFGHDRGASLDIPWVGTGCPNFKNGQSLFSTIVDPNSNNAQRNEAYMSPPVWKFSKKAGKKVKVRAPYSLTVSLICKDGKPFLHLKREDNEEINQHLFHKMQKKTVNGKNIEVEILNEFNDPSVSQIDDKSGGGEFKPASVPAKKGKGKKGKKITK